jgi:predicted DNA binding protein
MIISEILREGYLEYPKRITLRQLARKLRRSRTGTMLMLRRVFKKLINTAM